MIVEGYIVVYKYSVDTFFYIVGLPDDNEALLSGILNAFYDAVAILLRYFRNRH